MSARVRALVLALLVFSVTGCAGSPGFSLGTGRTLTPEQAANARTYYDQGVADFQTALQGNRRTAPGAYARARKAFERCVRLDPGNLEAQLKLVEVLGALREEKDLLIRVRAVVAADSMFIPGVEMLANRCYGLSLAFLTVGVLDPVKPGDVMAASQRTLLKAQGVRFKDLPRLLPEARAICERLLRMAPNDPRYLCALGAITNLEGDYKGAADIYYRVERMAPDFLRQNDFHNTIFSVSRENRIFVSGSPRSFLQNLGGRAFRLIPDRGPVGR